MFTPNRRLVNKLAKKSLYKIGDACWHCHAGIQTFTLNEPIKFDENYYLKVSAKVNSEEMLDKEFSITEKDLCPFQIPAKEELDKVGVTVIHLGDYIFWDTESQVEFIKKTYGWKEDNVEGTYKKYKSVECIMPGVHDYAKFIKRGFGRATDYASKDVRNGLITREEGFELIREVPSQNE